MIRSPAHLSYLKIQSLIALISVRDSKDHMASSTVSTCSFQNQQPPLNQQPPTSSSQSRQPPKKTRKRGIAALLDRTNEVCEQSCTRRPCKVNAQARVATMPTPTFQGRGDHALHVYIVCEIIQPRKRACKQVCITKCIWEAIAIQTMTIAMTELGLGVVPAADCWHSYWIFRPSCSMLGFCTLCHPCSIPSVT